MSDLKSVLKEAEHHLKDAVSNTSEHAGEFRDNALSKLKHAKEKAADMQELICNKSVAAARVTDEYVREHPWHSIGIAAVLGMALGLLINRK